MSSLLHIHTVFIGPHCGSLLHMFTVRACFDRPLTTRLHNSQVPCGNTFHCELQWVATRMGAQQTRLRISAAVVFDSHCWLKGTVTQKSKEVSCPSPCTARPSVRLRRIGPLSVYNLSSAHHAQLLQVVGLCSVQRTGCAPASLLCVLRGALAAQACTPCLSRIDE